MYHPKHCRHACLRHVLKVAAVAWVSGCLAFTLAVTPRASASYASPRIRAYDYALSQGGCWYSWGGTGPCWAGYDCSGLVYAAYRAAGVPYFGRDTYDMLASGRLHRVWHPQPGELAFYGDGHVELYVRWGVTFGALHPGARVGYHYWNAWWHPTQFDYAWGS